MMVIERVRGADVYGLLVDPRYIGYVTPFFKAGV